MAAREARAVRCAGGTVCSGRGGVVLWVDDLVDDLLDFVHDD